MDSASVSDLEGQFRRLGADTLASHTTLQSLVIVLARASGDESRLVSSSWDEDEAARNKWCFQ